MFDRYLIDGGYRGPSRVEVHEHKAPTDASARAYGELLERARKEIRELLPLGENSLVDALVYTQELSAGFTPKLHYAFKLNGQQFQGEAKVSRAQIVSDPSMVFRVVMEALAKVIAEQLILQAARDGGIR